MFPLQLSYTPKSFTLNKILVGEASHRCHPIGGQGLNLCWRDVNDLMRLIDKANKKIILSDPMEIKSWEQQHQNIRNHLFHFLSNPSLKLLSKVKLGSINFENLEHIVSPVIKNNTIFYVDDSFNVFSKNLENGKNYWRTQLKQEKKEKLSFIGGLAATDNELIVTTALGNIYSIDLNNGDIKWVKNFLVQFSRPPTIYKNKIFAVSDDNHIYFRIW